MRSVKYLLSTLMFFAFFTTMLADNGGISEAERKIDSLLTAENIPGCQAALFTADSLIWMKSFGVGDLATGEAVTDASLFRMGSITKTFVAVAVMQLVEQGKLSLDDRVRELVPEVTFVNPWEETDPVRVVHLLEHTTGWDDFSLKEYATSGMGLNLYEGLELAPRSRTSRWKPGRYMQYCNSGPAVAAYIVEKITAMDFESYLRHHVLNPLGMETSSLLLEEPVRKLLVKTYVEEQETDYWHILMRPAGSLNSNAREMVPFVQMLLNKGMHDSVHLLGAPSVYRMEQARTTLTSRTGNHHGYGLHNYTMNFEGFVFHGHAGGMPGALALYAYNRDLDAGFVTMINGSGMKALTGIVQALTGYLIGDQARPPAGTGSGFNDQYLGTYRTANSRMQISYPFEKILNFFTLSQEDGVIYAKSPFAEGREMIAGGAHILYQRTDSTMYDEYVFAADDGGQPIVSQVNAGWANYIQTSRFNAWALFGWFAGCLLLSLSMFVFGLIWLMVLGIRKWKKRTVRNTALKLMPFLAAISLFMAVAMFAFLPADRLMPWMGFPTVYSVTYYALNILFVLFAFISLYRSALFLREKGFRALKIYLLAVSLALSNLAIYFLYWGVIGLPTWM